MGATLVPLPERLTKEQIVEARVEKREVRTQLTKAAAEALCGAATLTVEQARELGDTRHCRGLTADEQRAMDKFYLRRDYCLLDRDPATLTPDMLVKLSKPKTRHIFDMQRGLVGCDPNRALLDARGEMAYDLARAESSNVFAHFLQKKYAFFQLHYANALVRSVGFKHLCDSPDFIEPGAPLATCNWWATRLPGPHRATRISGTDLLAALHRYVDPVVSNPREWDVLKQFAGGKLVRRTPAQYQSADFMGYLRFVNALFLARLGLSIKRGSDTATANYVLCNTMRASFSGGDWPSLI